MKKVYNKDDLYNGFKFYNKGENKEIYTLINLNNDSCGVSWSTLTGSKSNGKTSYSYTNILSNLNIGQWTQVQTELEYEIC